MKKRNKLFKSFVSIFTVLALCICSSVAITAFAVVFEFMPLSTMHTTSSLNIYSDTLTFGHSSQTVDCALVCGVSVPPNKNAGNLTFKGVLQRKISGNSWANVKTITAHLELKNTSTTAYKYVRAEIPNTANLIKGSEYRVRFFVDEYTGSETLKIYTQFNIDYKI